MRLIIASLFFILPFIACSQKWEQLASIPAAGRDDGVSFAINNFGYVVTGNQNGFTESNRLYQYSPTSNSWKEKALFPGESRQYAGSFVINGIAYLIGGYSSSNQALKDVWQYNPELDHWKQMKDFPGEPRWSFFTFATHEFGFLGTGATMTGPTVSDCWKYNPNFDSWEPISSYPEGAIREVHGFCIGNDCFAGSGFGVNPLTFSKKFFRYNVEFDEWQSINDFPGEGRGYAGMISNGKFGVVGGGWGDQNQFYQDFYKLNLNGEWTKIAGFPAQGWRGMSSFSIDNTAYFTTGLYEDLARSSDLYQLSFSQEDEVILYPNPSGENCSLYSSFGEKVEIFDALGNLVNELNTDDSGFCQLPKKSSGIYLIRISNSSKSEELKWIVR